LLQWFNSSNIKLNIFNAKRNLIECKKKGEIMITYEIAKNFDIEKIIEVFESSGIVRPTKEKERIKSMFENANLIYFAYDNGELIGLTRCVTDFSYCCYLSDLAVKKDYQKQGIGKMLIEKVRERIGEKVALILLSANSAMDYYPKINFEKADNAFIIKRKS